MNFQQFLLEAYGKDYQKDFSNLKLTNQDKSQSQFEFGSELGLKPQERKITYKTLQGKIQTYKKPGPSIRSFNDALYEKIVSRKLAELFVVFELECYIPLNPKDSIIELLDLSKEFNIKIANIYFNMTSVLSRLRTSLDVKTWLFQLIEKNKEELSSRVISALTDHVKAERYYMVDKQLREHGIIEKDDFIYDLYLKDTLKPYTFAEFMKKYDVGILSGYTLIKNNKQQDIIILDNRYQNLSVQYKELKDILLEKFKPTLFKNIAIDIRSPKENVDQTHWTLTEDSSLDEIGISLVPVELISPRINYKDIDKALADIYKVFTELNVKTTEETGLHVNIGFYNEQELDLIKLVLLSSDNEDLKDYNRLSNIYCQSQLNYLIQGGFSGNTPEDNFNELTRILNNQSVMFYKLFNGEKHMDINVKKWISTFPGYKPLIEFRALGGPRYFSSKYSF